MTTTAEAIEAIKTLRAMGARRVRVGDIEVEWSSGPVPASEAAPRLTPEERERQRRDAEEKLMFAASG